jgi:hypothetical protein
MRSQKKSVFLLAVSIGITMAFILLAPLGVTASVLAAPNIIRVTFTDTSPIQYTDLSGNVIGEGVHVGELQCVGDNCNQKIEFEPISQQTTEPVVFEYKFKSKQSFDPVGQRLVVSGVGTMSGSGPKIRFAFTGVFEDNGDGTVQVTYIASTPEASFVFPAAPGTFSIIGNN